MSCKPEDLREVIASFTGGSDRRYKHPLAPRFIYSEGMKAMAEAAGAYWLLDWIAFNAAPKFAKSWLAGEAGIGIVKITVAEGKATLTLSLVDDAPLAVKEELSFTDFPDGEWNFYLGTDEISEGQYITTAYLPSEH